MQNPFPKILIVTTILAVSGFFVAGPTGLDGLSFSVGIILGGIVAGLIAVATFNAAAPASKSTPARPPAPRPAPTVTKTNNAPANNAVEGDMQTLFVGNLAFRANRHALVKLFSEQGNVHNARIVTDRNTRKPKGYGFVEMSTADANKAIAALDGSEFYGRELKVGLANKRDQ
jgi:hypothetical protein